MFPMVRPCWVTSQDDGPATPVHSHRAYVDRYGNGTTDVRVSHMHYVLDGKVLPSADGHAHILTNIPCGSGR